MKYPKISVLSSSEEEAIINDKRWKALSQEQTKEWIFAFTLISPYLSLFSEVHQFWDQNTLISSLHWDKGDNKNILRDQKFLPLRKRFWVSDAAKVMELLKFQKMPVFQKPFGSFNQWQKKVTNLNELSSYFIERYSESQLFWYSETILITTSYDLVVL